MSTHISCLALRPLRDTALRQALLVDPQPMKPLEAANSATTLVTTTCSTICKKLGPPFSSHWDPVQLSTQDRLMCFKDKARIPEEDTRPG